MKYTVSSIIFDFDGVLLESNHIRTKGFIELLRNKKYDQEKIDQFIDFHLSNGGLSRYYKLRYFFEKILKINITDTILSSLCNEYSSLVKKGVIESKWVEGAQEFLEGNYHKYKLFIVSSSDQNELREICHLRNITRYFEDILGSPTDKKTNIKNLISKYHLEYNHTLFLGDSINDWEAAQLNNIRFIYRNSGGRCEFCKDVIVMNNLLDLPTYILPLKN